MKFLVDNRRDFGASKRTDIDENEEIFGEHILKAMLIVVAERNKPWKEKE